MEGLKVIVLTLMIPMALLLGFGFVMAFMASAKSGQFDDLETPALRILKDENQKGKAHHESSK
jgi:cbb3-type cytochrome oxidase maturation protein